MNITQKGDRPLGLTIGYGVKKSEASSAVKGKVFSVGRQLANEIKRRIRQQVYDWPDLNARYLQWKEEQGLDTRMLIAYGYYINAIDAWETPKGVRVGVRNEVHGKSKIPLRLIGLWLEYGTYNADGTVRMPARPHWRPTILDWKNNKFPKEKRDLHQMLVEQAKKELRKRLRKLLDGVYHGV